MRFSLASVFALLTLLCVLSVLIPGVAMFLIGFSPCLLGLALFMIADHFNNETFRMAGLLLVAVGIMISGPLMNMVSQL